MLTELNLYNCSADYPDRVAGGRCTEAVNKISSTAANSPRQQQLSSLYYNLSSAITPPYNSPYDNKFQPLYYSPQLLDDLYKYNRLIAPSSPPSYYQMQLPLTPPLSNTPPTDAAPIHINAAVSPLIAIEHNAEISGTTCETQRTQSVIMKVEHQKIVEIPAAHLSSPVSSESSSEIIICKWANCYRCVFISSKCIIDFHFLFT